MLNPSLSALPILSAFLKHQLRSTRQPSEAVSGVAQKEASEVFFSVTKLYQSKDANLRRMVYLVIKVSILLSGKTFTDLPQVWR